MLQNLRFCKHFSKIHRISRALKIENKEWIIIGKHHCSHHNPYYSTDHNRDSGGSFSYFFGIVQAK